MKNIFPLLIFSSLLFFHGCKEDESTVVTGFSIDKTSLVEGAAKNSQVLSVTALGSLNSTVQVTYQIKEGTAKAGVDITTAQGQLEFSKGQLSASLPIELLGDTYLELGESFDIVFSYNGNDFTSTIEITNDDTMEDILSAEDGFYTPESYPSMQAVFKDEFDASTLNLAKWTHDLGNGCSAGICGWGNNELETYTNSPENIKLSNGKLVITALNNNATYTSARIKTQDKVEVKFGRIDVRAKLPKGQGIWPAIWMLGENIDVAGSPWPICGEIDIMEVVGHRPAELVGTVHYNSEGYKYSSSSTTLTSGDFSDKFHVFSLVWDKNKIIWYLDNKPFKEFTNTNISGYPFNKPFFFILNVAVGGNWPGKPDATTVFPQEMIVDYIRVFQ